MNSRPIQNLLSGNNIASFSVAEGGKNVQIVEKTEVYDDSAPIAVQRSQDPEHVRLDESRARVTRDIFDHGDDGTLDEKKRYMVERSLTYDSIKSGQPPSDKRDNYTEKYSVNATKIAYDPTGKVTWRENTFRNSYKTDSQKNLRDYQGDSRFQGDGMNDNTGGKYIFGQAEQMSVDRIEDFRREGDSDRITITLTEAVKGGDWKKSRAEHVEEDPQQNHILNPIGFQYIDFKPID